MSFEAIGLPHCSLAGSLWRLSTQHVSRVAPQVSRILWDMTLVNTLEDSLQTLFFFTPAGGCTDMLGRPGLRGFRFPFCPALPQVITLPQSSMVLAAVLWNVASDAELNLSQALPAQKAKLYLYPRTSGFQDFEAGKLPSCWSANTSSPSFPVTRQRNLRLANSRAKPALFHSLCCGCSQFTLA